MVPFHPVPDEMLSSTGAHSSFRPRRVPREQAWALPVQRTRSHGAESAGSTSPGGIWNDLVYEPSRSLGVVVTTRKKSFKRRRWQSAGNSRLKFGNGSKRRFQPTDFGKGYRIDHDYIPWRQVSRHLVGAEKGTATNSHHAWQHTSS